MADFSPENLDSIADQVLRDTASTSPVEEEVKKNLSVATPDQERLDAIADQVLADTLPEQQDIQTDNTVEPEVDEHVSVVDRILGVGETIVSGGTSGIGFILGTLAGGIGLATETAEHIAGNPNAEPLDTFMNVQAGVTDAFTWKPLTKTREQIDKAIKDYIIEPYEEYVQKAGREVEEQVVNREIQPASELGGAQSRTITEAQLRAAPVILSLLFPSVRKPFLKTEKSTDPGVTQVDPLPQSHEQIIQTMKKQDVNELAAQPPEALALQLESIDNRIKSIDDSMQRANPREQAALEVMKQELLDQREGVQGAVLRKDLAEIEDFWEYKFENVPDRMNTVVLPENGKNIPTLKGEVFNIQTKLRKDGNKAFVFSPKWKDIGDLSKLIEGNISAGKFLSEKNPVIKWGVDKVTAHMKRAEAMSATLIHRPEFISRPGITALRTAQTKATDKGGLTIYDELIQDPKVGEGLVKNFLELESKAIARNSKISKIDMEDAGMSPRAQEAYKAVTHMLEATRKIVNRAIRDTGVDAPLLHKIPGYMPHMFLGEFKIFAKDAQGKVVKVLPTTNKKNAKKMVEQLQKDHPDLTFDVAKNNTFVKAGELDKLDPNRQKDISMQLFSQMMINSRREDPKALSLQRSYDAMLNKTFAARHASERKGVDGFLGHDFNPRDFRKALELYVKGGTKYAETLRMRKEMESLYLDSQLRTAYPNSLEVVKRYQDNALNIKGTVDTIIDNQIGKWVTANGLEKTLSKANVFGSIKTLFAFNAKFLAAQMIQPFEAMPPALVRQKGRGDKGSVIKAMLEAQKEFFLPTDESVRAIRKATENGTIEAKFINELLAPDKQRLFESTKGHSTMENALGITLAQATEARSRTMAFLMAYRHQRNSGVPEAEAIKKASFITDKHMVEYNLRERPMIFGQTGLGSPGAAIRTFKTFSFNRLSQWVSYYRTAKVEKDRGPIGTMLAMNVATAGITGVIGIKAADAMLESMGYPTISDHMIEQGASDTLIYGAPSSLSGIDLHSTLAAPSLMPQELFSVPGVEMSTDAAKAMWEYSKDFYRGTVTDTSELKLATAVLPKAMLGVYEDYVFKGQLAPFPSDASKRTINRNLSDRVARILGSRSTREKRILDEFWSAQKFSSKRQEKAEVFLNYAAYRLANGLEVPDAVWQILIDETDANLSSISSKIETRFKNTELELKTRLQMMAKSKKGFNKLKQLDNSPYMGRD